MAAMIVSSIVVPKLAEAQKSTIDYRKMERDIAIMEKILEDLLASGDRLPPWNRRVHGLYLESYGVVFYVRGTDFPLLKVQKQLQLLKVQKQLGETQKRLEETRKRVEEVGEHLRERVDEAGEHLREHTEKARKQVEETGERLREQVSEAGKQLRGQMEEKQVLEAQKQMEEAKSNCKNRQKGFKSR
jgi:peptidoglycan hydrolase CwlO-like protein